MSTLQHATRIGLLMAGASALLGGRFATPRPISPTDFVTSTARADRAQSLDGRRLPGDRPPAPSAGNRRGPSRPRWRRSGLVGARGAGTLLRVRSAPGHPDVSPRPRVLREQAAWLACVLALLNPIIGYVVVNVLSESTFLLWWTFGLWGAVRFLREGRFFWLPLAIGFGALAYLTRPEGMLLPAAIVADLVAAADAAGDPDQLAPMVAVHGFPGEGSFSWSGPYIAMKGGLGTKPGIARVLGWRRGRTPWGWSVSTAPRRRDDGGGLQGRHGPDDQGLPRWR